MNDPQAEDPTATPVDTLVPAAPSAALMARLRAARPPRQVATSVSSRPPAQARPSRWLPLAACAAAAAALATVVAIKTEWRFARSPSVTVNSSAHAPTEEPPSSAATATPTPVASAPPVYLPIETTSHLVSLQPVPLEQRPDEAPQRLLRAIFIEDTTAVGADTDAALVVRRAREVYFPVQGTVY
jgi:hypothetical protein